MTSSEMLALGVAVGVIVAQIGATITSVIIARRASHALSVVAAKADVIAHHVNSAATASAAKIEALEEKVAMLLVSLADAKERAALLAQYQASGGGA